jgi:hypothetical protein
VSTTKKRRTAKQPALGASYHPHPARPGVHNYEIDPYRMLAGPGLPKTGCLILFARAGGETLEVDAAVLTRDSFLEWLRRNDTQTHRDPGYEHRERIILKVLRYT